MDISAAIDEYLGAKQNSITAKTNRWYTWLLGLFEKWCIDNKLTDLSQITAVHVQTFAAAAGSNNTYTRHHRAQVVKGFLAWCSLDEEFGVRERTVKRIEMPRIEQSEIVLFTDAELLRLFRACDKLPHPHRNRAIIHMLLDTGIRASEACYDGFRPSEETGLKMENLYLGRGSDSYIWIVGKGRKPRTIGLGQETAQAMRRYINRERGQSLCPYVFMSQRDTPLGVRMLEQFISDLGDIAGVADVYCHRFRHQFAVTQLLNGTSDFVLMQLMGHTSTESLKPYTRSMTHIQARNAAPSIVDKLKRQQRY